MDIYYIYLFWGNKDDEALGKINWLDRPQSFTIFSYLFLTAPAEL